MSQSTSPGGNVIQDLRDPFADSRVGRRPIDKTVVDRELSAQCYDEDCQGREEHSRSSRGCLLSGGVDYPWFYAGAGKLDP